MLPAIYNPTIKQGTPFRRWLIVTDKAGIPLPLAGASFAGQVRNVDGLQVLANIAFVIMDLETGKIEWSIADTSRLPSTDGHPQLPYDMFITPAIGDRICPVEGLIEVEATYTSLGATP